MILRVCVWYSNCSTQYKAKPHSEDFMNKCIWIFLFMFVVGCTGILEEMNGKLSVDSAFDIITENKLVNVPPGDYTMSVKFEQGIVGVSDPKIILSTKKNKFVIPFPSSAINTENSTLIASSSMLKQAFSLNAKKETTLLRSYQDEAITSCTFCGLCGENTVTLDSKGTPTTQYQITFNCNCNGSKKVLYNYQEFIDTYIINFKDKSSYPVANFKGQTKKFTKKSPIKDLSKCN